MSAPNQSTHRRLGATIAFVVIALYYAAVFRPLAAREQDQTRPIERIQAELRAAATNNPAISGLALDALTRRDASLRVSLTNAALARQLITRRFAPEPAIATNLGRNFQLIDYQNERLTRGDRLINFASERKVKITPAVTAGLPEFTIENPLPELLWGQLAMMDGVLRAAIEAGVQSIEDVKMPAPVRHSSGTSQRTLLVEVPLRIELIGTSEAIARWLGLVLLDTEGRAALKLPAVEGLPSVCLQRVLARKETTDAPGLVRLGAELNGFLQLPAPANAPANRSTPGASN
jgi:hypothetical protein